MTLPDRRADQHAASLLSRFDLIFVMGDKPDPKRDGAIADHILKAHSIGETHRPALPHSHPGCR